MATKYTSYVIDPQNKEYVKVSTSSGGSGVSYDALEDLPVVNVKGNTENSFVNISGLSYGNYSISGYYKLSSDSDIQNTGADYISMTVTNDTETGRKVAIFDTSENYKVITNLVIYNGTEIERIIKQGPGIYWDNF